MAKTAPIKSETDNQNSTISTASLDNDDTVETDVEAKDQPRTTKTEEGNENSTIYAAPLQSDQTVEQNTLESEVEADDEPATTTNRDVGCNKFFPSVGMTLTVARE